MKKIPKQASWTWRSLYVSVIAALVYFASNQESHSIPQGRQLSREYSTPQAHFYHFSLSRSEGKTTTTYAVNLDAIGLPVTTDPNSADENARVKIERSNDSLEVCVQQCLEAQVHDANTYELIGEGPYPTNKGSTEVFSPYQKSEMKEYITKHVGEISKSPLYTANEFQRTKYLWQLERGMARLLTKELGRDVTVKIDRSQF